MIVVSDTTAITNLYRIGRLYLLKEVFGVILIPPAVEVELAEVPGQLEFILEMDFLEIRNPEDSTAVTNFKSVLDDGEAEAITFRLAWCSSSTAQTY